jgi:hypothetical protein
MGSDRVESEYSHKDQDIFRYEWLKLGHCWQIISLHRGWDGCWEGWSSLQGITHYLLIQSIILILNSLVRAGF